MRQWRRQCVDPLLYSLFYCPAVLHLRRRPGAVPDVSAHRRHNVKPACLSCHFRVILQCGPHVCLCRASHLPWSRSCPRTIDQQESSCLPECWKTEAIKQFFFNQQLVLPGRKLVWGSTKNERMLEDDNRRDRSHVHQVPLGRWLIEFL